VPLRTLLLLELTATAALTLAAAAAWVVLQLHRSCTADGKSSNRKGGRQIGLLAAAPENAVIAGDCSIALQAATGDHDHTARAEAAVHGTTSHSVYHQQQQQQLQQTTHELKTANADLSQSPAAAAAGVTTDPPAAPLIDVWILAGQSNMVGWNKADGQPMPQLSEPWPGEVLAFNSKGGQDS
jgi:hypothetical protein